MSHKKRDNLKIKLISNRKKKKEKKEFTIAKQLNRDKRKKKQSK